MSSPNRLFVVTRTRGPAWDGSQAMEEQSDWPAHAAFMDALVNDGFVLLGGPLDGTPEVLLIVRSSDATSIEARLSADPWGQDMLRLTRIVAWTLRLGSL